MPTITSVSPTSGPTSGGNSVVITGTGFAFVPTTVRFGANATTFTINSPTQITAIAPSGTGTVQVTVSNSDGTSNGVPYTFAQVPSLTSLSPTGGPAAGGTPVTLTGSSLSGTTAVNFGATPAVSFTVVSDTQVTAVAPPGAGTVQVTVTTPLGSSNGLPFTYVGVPVIVSISPSSGPVSGGVLVSLTGSGFTGATAVNFGATPATFFGVLSDTSIIAIAPPGTGTVAVTVTAAAGTSAGVSFTYVPAPTLTSISPTTGPVTGGTTVTLTGTGFTGATAVVFGILPATSFTVNSPTQITAVTPVGIGTVPVTVATPGGIATGVSFTYVLPPILFFLNPPVGPQAGGTSVTLTGVGLSATTGVNFGATPAASFTVVSDSQVTAVAPPGTGTVQVTVTTSSGSSNGLPFTYVGIPAIVSISPNFGPVTGGVVVSLTGSGFTGATAVNFGATPATFFVALSNTSIIALAPPGTGTVPVTVTTAAGTSAGVSFTYVPAPTLTSISPTTGPVTGGTTVTLTGTGFTGATAVFFGILPATSFTINSSTQITAVTPVGLGTVPVTVATPGGIATGVFYTYS
ncbi:IPT/TIG domain-containing protein [Nocardia sp. NBC_00508]|uniref:IPT/TIG domain-containing protein n=1 Tax=Nocardia sp. NBC_00508 TaxID=2975992 RepID=UPI002E81A53A|nr:IPT/TIG domain-containing protein [Nocardia sp. NBC_00508]WUD64710.1 IPT/TIG domain-containing protein [Nocardia sp. NBC_00508]